jgi:mRNA interferase RelE/StbE
LTALKALENDPPEGDIKALTSIKDSYRIRIGNYRAIFRIKNNAILVTDIIARGQAYKKK